MPPLPPHDFHAFPKVATLPDTETIASQAEDIKMRQGWSISDPMFEINTELFTLLEFLVLDNEVQGIHLPEGPNDF